MSRYLIFAVANLTMVFVAMAHTSVAVAFPVMTEELNASLVLTGWVLGAYQLVMVAAVPLAGKAADTMGRKRVFVASLALFTGGSLLSAVAPNIGLLIAARAIQGMGGGGLIPLSVAVVADAFPDSRQRAIGLTSSFFPIGMIIGPNLGGWMVTALGWRSVLWLNVPFGIVLLLAILMLLKPRERVAGSLDLGGGGLLAGSILGILAGLSVLDKGLTAPFIATASVLVVLGIALAVAFWRREKRVQQPLIELDLLRGRPFVAANVYNFLYGLGVLGVVYLLPLYAVATYGSTTFESGVFLTPRSLGMMGASIITSIYVMRWGYRRPIVIGACLMIASTALLGAEPGREGGTTGLALLWLPLLIMGFSGLGAGIASPGSNNACIELAPDKVATITALRALFRQTGATIFITAGTLVLHFAGDMARGFRYLLLGTAVLMLLMLPAAFIMPKGPNCSPEEGKE
ncbi:MAG: MFS transporter [Chloroflexi bacterium]|nr:MFS transporter [Chloroflexota bacterium]